MHTIVHTLFIYYACTVHVFKNIKNESHDTIHTFKNYFATIFSVFNFSNNKFNPNGPYVFPPLSLWLKNSKLWQKHMYKRGNLPNYF